MIGAPAQPATPAFKRIDAKIDFNWWDRAPEGLNDDDFGVRWTGFITAPSTGTYHLGAIGMNAFELYLDGKRIASFNNIHEHAYASAPVTFEAGKRYAIRLDYHQFLNNADIRLVWSPPAPNLEAEAIETARQADAVVMVMGLSPRLEGEEMPVRIEGFKGGDRLTLDIPQVQRDLMEKVAALGKPTVLVLMNGSAVACTWARDHVPAIVEAWYPGEAGGTALADVLFGDYNPAGRLPVTFYKSVDDLPPFTDYAMKGRTYRYFTGEPLYPFGYGLSYTTFAYRNLHVPTKIKRGQPVTVSVEVENTGSMAGEEVAELYVGMPGGQWPIPIRSLAGFQRVSLKPHEHRTLQFTIAPKHIISIPTGDPNSKQVHVVGGYLPPPHRTISVGGKQPGFTGPADAVTTSVVSAEVHFTSN
jgi:beta-glucosidase